MNESIRAGIRANALEFLQYHPFYFKDVKRIGRDKIKAVLDEINHLDFVEFEQQALRYWLDKPNKPKHWSTLEDILLAINSLAKSKEGVDAEQKNGS